MSFLYIIVKQNYTKEKGNVKIYLDYLKNIAVAIKRLAITFIKEENKFMNKFMDYANQEAIRGFMQDAGGPFGAVIVREGKIVASAHNEVLKTNDPTAHAEVNAIRKAAARLNKFDLSDCELYTSCEPCPMCLAAIYWARITKVYYGCTRYDAANIGFDDNAIYEYIKFPDKYQENLRLLPLDREQCLMSFQKWQEKQDRIIY